MLLEEGAEVTGYDIETEGVLKAAGLVGQFPVQSGDIMDLNAMKQAVSDHKVIIHLAAYSGVEHARKLGYEAWRVNAFGTLNVLEACRLSKGIESVLVSTTNHLYGNAPALPTAEDAPLLQLDTYSASKLAADVMTRSYAHNYGLPATVIRNTNCYGPNDPHSDHIVPGTIMSVMGNECPVIRGTGDTSKSYLYVDDVSEAYMAITQWVMESQRGGEAFNVSTAPVTVRKLVDSILRVMGSGLEPLILGNVTDGADEQLDCTKISQLTSWKPRHTLEEGLMRTVQGFAERSLSAR
jgi:CDP-glucose 4,6-dehydratase